MRKQVKKPKVGDTITPLRLESPYLAGCAEAGIAVVSAELHRSPDDNWVVINHSAKQLRDCPACGSDDIIRRPWNDWTHVVNHSPIEPPGKHYVRRLISYVSLATQCRDCKAVKTHPAPDFIHPVMNKMTHDLVDYIYDIVQVNRAGRRIANQADLAAKLRITPKLVHRVKKTMNEQENNNGETEIE